MYTGIPPVFFMESVTGTCKNPSDRSVHDFPNSAFTVRCIGAAVGWYMVEYARLTPLRSAVATTPAANLLGCGTPFHDLSRTRRHSAHRDQHHRGMNISA